MNLICGKLCWILPKFPFVILGSHLGRSWQSTRSREGSFIVIWSSACCCTVYLCLNFLYWTCSFSCTRHGHISWTWTDTGLNTRSCTWFFSRAADTHSRLSMTYTILTNICRGNAVLCFLNRDKLKMIASSRVKFSGSKLTLRSDLQVGATREAVIDNCNW